MPCLDGGPKPAGEDRPKGFFGVDCVLIGEDKRCCQLHKEDTGQIPEGACVDVRKLQAGENLTRHLGDATLSLR